MASQLDFLLAGLTDTNGDDLTGGKVYSYEAGTSTDKNLWTDKDETVVAANPVILDAYGKSLIYGNGWYKFVVKDSNDVTLYTWNNVVISNEVQNLISTSLFSVFIGTNAGASITTGSWNVGIGYNNSANLTGGSYNVSLGARALQTTTGSYYNSAIGTYALMNATSGDSNTVIGYKALYDLTTGDDNVGMGVSVLENITSGTNNVSIGKLSSFYLYDGIGNICLGTKAGYNLYSGDFNILIGYWTGDTGAIGDKNILIGYQLDLKASYDNEYLSIGNLIFGRGMNAVGSGVSSGNIGFRTQSEFGDGQGVIGIANAGTLPTAAPTGGGVLYEDSGYLKHRSPDNISVLLSNEPNAVISRTCIEDDFDTSIYGSSGAYRLGRFAWFVSSGLSPNKSTSEQNHPGIDRIIWPATTGQVEYIYSYVGAFSFPSDAVYIIKTSTLVSSFALKIGFQVNTSFGDSNEISFTYDSAVNLSWLCKTISSSTETSTASGINVTTNTWYKLYIKRRSGSVEFYINGSLVATHTTNIPSVYTLGPIIVGKSLEALSKAIYVDYFGYYSEGLSR